MTDDTTSSSTQTVMHGIYPTPQNTTVLDRPEVVGMWVRTQRKKMGMTQVELAKKAEVTQRLISEFESGKAGIRLDTLLKIFRILELRLATVDLKIPTHQNSEFLW